MNDESPSVPGAENPEKHTGLRKGSIKKTAAGMPAIVSSLKQVAAEAGLIRGMKALSKMNKKDGFDCPSCAWPDPDDERSGLGEYCENGARAVAEEATTKRLDAAFFSHHSVRSEEHTSELQSPCNLVCRLLLEKKKIMIHQYMIKM